ncbi:unnamed protein product [Symbiodinium sp. CCMP2592]|nr:unnamed protein product [Symbiodinium sp. CCMP2592]
MAVSTAKQALFWQAFIGSVLSAAWLQSFHGCQNLDTVAMNLAESFVDSVKWYMSSLTRSVSFIKYMQRVALDYSLDKAYDMVMYERVIAKTPPPAKQQIRKATDSMFKKINVKTVTKGLKVALKVLEFIPEAAPFEEAAATAVDIGGAIVTAGLALYKMTCEMVTSVGGLDPTVEDEEGLLYQKAGPAERVAYQKDNIRASWFIFQDDLVAGIKTQMQNVVASAAKRDLMAQGLVDLEGLFDPDPERQKGQTAAMDAKTGWALEEGKVTRTNSVAFQFADNYVRYHAYTALLPAAYRVCVENDYICKRSPMMRQRIHDDSFDCCMSRKVESIKNAFSRGPFHPVHCHSCTPTSCLREQALAAGGGLLWDANETFQQKDNPCPKEFKGYPWRLNGGSCSLYVYNRPNRGHPKTKKQKTEFCKILEDWSVKRSSEVQPRSLSGWLCGFESEADMEKSFQANEALQSDLDKLVSWFTGSELSKTDGYATFGDMLKEQVVGPVRKPFVVAGGFSLEILRLPNAKYVNSPAGRSYIYSQNVHTQGCQLQKSFNACQKPRRFQGGERDGHCGHELMIDEGCFKGEAEGPLIPVPACSKAYCKHTCNTKNHPCESNGHGVVSEDKKDKKRCDCSGCQACPKCQQVVFGPNEPPKEGVCKDLEKGLTCPELVTSKNWLNQDTDKYIFHVHTESEHGQTRRACAIKKSGPGDGPGWNINLAILCCPRTL